MKEVQVINAREMYRVALEKLRSGFSSIGIMKPALNNGDGSFIVGVNQHIFLIDMPWKIT